MNIRNIATSISDLEIEDQDNEEQRCRLRLGRQIYSKQFGEKWPFYLKPFFSGIPMSCKSHILLVPRDKDRKISNFLLETKSPSWILNLECVKQKRSGCVAEKNGASARLDLTSGMSVILGRKRQKERQRDPNAVNCVASYKLETTVFDQVSKVQFTAILVDQRNALLSK